LNGCNKDENPVKNSNPVNVIDTVEYFNWKIDSFNYPIADVLPFDSNNYYMTFQSLPYLIHFKDGIQNDIDLGAPIFRGGPIRAKTENKIYAGGMHWNGNDNKAQLRIIENGNVSFFSVPDDSTFLVSDMLIDKNDDLWISTDINIIYKFSNGKFRKYIIGDSLFESKFYEDNSNQIFVYSICNIGTSIRYNIKKIVNDSMIFISDEFLSTDHDKFVGDEGICLNNDFVVSSMHTFFIFIGNKWNPFYSNNDIQFQSSLNGFSSNFLFCFLNSNIVNSNYNVGLILENGKMHYEKNLKLIANETPP